MFLKQASLDSGVVQSQPIVEPVVFRGRTVSSLRRTDGKNYMLLEAVCRVFFPTQSVDAFVNCVERVLHLPVGELTDEEQRYFIEFYRLPTNCLRCRKLICTDDFEKYFPQIEYSFRSTLQQQPVSQSQAQSKTSVTVGTVCLQQPTARSAAAEKSATAKRKRPRKRVFSDVVVIDD